MKNLRWLWTLLQIGGSVVLLLLVLREVPFSGLLAQGEKLPLWLIAGAFGAYVASYLLAVVVWWYVLRGLGIMPGFGRVLLAHLSGLFYGTVVPSTVSGDLGRGVRLHASVKNPQKITASIIIDRLSGIAVFGIVMAIGTPLYLNTLPFDGTMWLSQVPVWGGVLVLALAIGLLIYRRFPHVFDPYILLILGKWRIFIGAVAITLLVHTLVAVMLWLLVRPFWEGASVLYCLYIVELLQVAEALPISVAGLGVREGLYVVMFAAVSVTRSEAVTVSLVQFALFMVVALCGGLVEVLYGLRGLMRVPERESVG